MCFSATVSFAAAGVTGLAGVLSLRRVQSRAEIPFAAMPLVFSAQQALEGAVWLALDNAGQIEIGHLAALGFLLVALGLWPIYVPIAALGVEDNPRRRQFMFGFLAVGIGVSAGYMWTLIDTGFDVSLADNHVRYAIDYRLLEVTIAGYLVATVLPMLASSRSALRWLGLLVVCGYAVSFAAYWGAFLSVWCFFAAVGSVIIYLHFRSAPQSAFGKPV